MSMTERRVLRDDRRRAGRELARRHQFLQSVINDVSDPILVVGTDMRVKLINRAARDFPALREACADNDFCYRAMFGFDQPCDRLGRPCPLVDVLESGAPVAVEHAQETGDGERRYYEILASPLMGENGDFLGIIETLRDVTERRRTAEILRRGHEELENRVRERTADLLQANKALRNEVEERRRAEDELLQAKEQAELLYRVVPSAIFTVDMTRRITSWNNKAEGITGYRSEEILGKKCSVFALHPCSSGCGILSGKVKKPIIGKECEIRTKDGAMRTISKNADLLRDTAGTVIGGIESFEDITDRKQVERQLRTERDKLKGMLTALGQGMHILNRDYVIEYQNSVLREDFGDKIGHKCYAVYKQEDAPCEVCRMREAMETNEIQRTELMMANGRYYEQSYAPFTDIDGEVKVLILLRDITEEKTHQAETLRAGQLAAIGELAAGVAHEINNPINGIINYAQLLLDEAGGNGPDKEILGRVIKEGERIAGIVSNLLSFARQRKEESEELVGIGTVIDDSLALIKHHFLKEGIILTVEVPENLPPVQVNPQQLQQVVLNLLSNARYALNQRYPGRDDRKRLDIRCRTVTLNGNDYVQASFTDFGTGIPKNIIGKIFDPFFSSKKPGEGTGLGLSISYGLIKECKGFMHVESEPDRFTTMTIEIPVAEQAAVQGPAPNQKGTENDRSA